MEEIASLSCTIMRGGTSKGIFLKEEELSKDSSIRDKQILNVFGSPDTRQIDGLGGADVLTSKLAIIGPSTKAGADVDYTFGQVSIDKPLIDYTGNCGNISSAVGPYAIDAGLVKAVEPYTTVNIHMTNTKKILQAIVPVERGKAKSQGDFKIDGVPGTGAKIKLDWSDCTGAITGKVLPTGNPVDQIEVGNQIFPVTLIDAGNPVVFVKADSLGVVWNSDFTDDSTKMDLIEAIRSRAAKIFGLVENYAEATEKSPYSPFIAVVSEAEAYTGLNDAVVEERSIDFCAKTIFMQKIHKAYPISGTIATGIAARIKGTVVNELIKNSKFNAEEEVFIGHPSGVISTAIVVEEDNKVKKAEVYRTARKIMEGTVFI